MSIRTTEQVWICRTQCGVCGVVHKARDPEPTSCPPGWIYLELSCSARRLRGDAQKVVALMDDMAHMSGEINVKDVADKTLEVAHLTMSESVSLDVFLCEDCATTSTVTIAELVAQMGKGAEDIPGFPGGPPIPTVRPQSTPQVPWSGGLSLVPSAGAMVQDEEERGNGEEEGEEGDEDEEGEDN